MAYKGHDYNLHTYLAALGSEYKFCEYEAILWLKLEL